MLTRIMLMEVAFFLSPWPLTQGLSAQLHLVLYLCHPAGPAHQPITVWLDYPSLQGREPRLVQSHSDLTSPREGEWLIHGHTAEDWLSRVRTRPVRVEGPGCSVPGCLAFCPGEKWCCRERLWLRNHLETSTRALIFCPLSNSN